MCNRFHSLPSCFAQSHVIPKKMRGYFLYKKAPKFREETVGGVEGEEASVWQGFALRGLGVNVTLPLIGPRPTAIPLGPVWPPP